MNVAEYRKRVKEMIAKTEDAPSKGQPGEKADPKSKKDFDDAKVGLGFLILRNALRASETLALAVGTDMTGLEKNCMEDALFVKSWEAYSRDMLAGREFSPGMMVCFCLASQMIYTVRENKRSRPAEEGEIHEVDDGTEQSPPPAKRHAQANRDNDASHSESPPRMRAPYSFPDYDDESVGSDDETSDEDLMRD